jgi:hypothetical protein
MSDGNGGNGGGGDVLLRFQYNIRALERAQHSVGVKWEESDAKLFSIRFDRRMRSL